MNIIRFYMLKLAHAALSLFRRTPIVGALADTRIKDHTEALLELVVAVATSTVPVWLGAIIMLTNKNNKLSWWDLAINNVYNGELLLYSTAALGPIYYFMFKENGNMKTFPNVRSMIILTTGIFLISVGLFAAQRAQVIYSGVANFDKPFVFSLSWKIYLGSLVIVYLSYVYRNLRETGAVDVSAQQERAFVRAFQDRQELQ